MGAQRALAAAGADLPVFAQVTVETTGTMLVGSEIGAALTALEALGVDGIGLNCATGPAEMSEHLRHLARHASIPLTCMPNAGLPMLTRDGAYYPLTPVRAGRRARRLHQRVRPRAGRRVLRHDPRAPACRRRAGARPRRPGPAPAPRAGRREHLPARAVPAGHDVPLDRRAHERQRLQGLPRGDAGRALGRVRRHRPQPDPRRRAPARRLRRLRGPRRRRRHARGRRAGSRPRRPCRWCSTPPSPPWSRRAWSSSAAARSSTSVNFEDGDGPGSRFDEDHADRRASTARPSSR